MNGSQFGMSLNGIIFLLIKIPYREYNMLTCSTAIYFQEKKNGGVSQCENLHFGRKKNGLGLNCSHIISTLYLTALADQIQ